MFFTERPVFGCDSCDREFASQYAAGQHMTALNHWRFPYECNWCTDKYRFEDDADSHMESCEHRPRFGCDACDALFNSDLAARQHMNQNNHWRRGHYCPECDREFQNSNNLKQHLHSRVHQGQNVRCPFCNQNFTTASGVAHHLESSACPKARNLTRANIHAELRKRDPRGHITKKLLTYPGSSDEDVIYATEASWNGNCYECYLCHRGFIKLSSLNQHLSSPAHQQKLYICPNRGTYGKEFVSLAAFCNHLESESCRFMKFEQVRNTAKNMFNFNSSRAIAF